MLAQTETQAIDPATPGILALREVIRQRKATRDAQTVAQQAAIQSADALLHLASVSARVGLRRSTIYKLMQVGEFPQPVRLGLRCVRWRLGDISAWLTGKSGNL